MVIINSDSTGTLVSLENGIKLPREVDYKLQSYWEDSRKTQLCVADEDLGDCLSTDPIFLPTSGRVDEYLAQNSDLTDSCDSLLAEAPVTLNQSTSDRVVYVAQGEVAHAISSDCDMLASDRATTCHILALHSACESTQHSPLSSMTHLDDTCYDKCIRDMIHTHLAHHRQQQQQQGSEMPEWEEKKCETYSSSSLDELVDMEVHIVGGFEDKEGTSVQMSNWLLHLLADIAEDYRDCLQLKLKTCAISSLNDTGYGRPIGRGLGMNVRTGEVFLAKVDTSLHGPAMEVRSLRCWAGPQRQLAVVHTPTNNQFCIDPFHFSSVPELDQLLNLPDQVLLQCTSTSPDAEEADFCELLRSSLLFLRDTPCAKVFGPFLNQPLVFDRECSKSNAWKKTNY